MTGADDATLDDLADRIARRIAGPVFLTTRQAYRHLGVSRNKFYRLAGRPGFPRKVLVLRGEGGEPDTLMYRRADLDEWGKTRPTPRGRGA